MCSGWTPAWRGSASPRSLVTAGEPVLIWADTVTTGAGEPEAERLKVLAEAVRRGDRDTSPVSVAVERVAFNRNQVSALTVARATGAVMVVAAEAGLAVEEYSPTEVKSAVTGAGNADKRQVRMALERVHGFRDLPAKPDAVDAAAVALTHLAGSAAEGGRARWSRPVISFLEGEVVHKGATSVVLAVGGVGYDVSVPTSVVSRLPGVGKTARVHTRMVVRDDSMTLYGFSSTDERELFDLLTG